MIVKGRNRDSAWYSIIDGEWPDLARPIDVAFAGKLRCRRTPAQSLSS